MKVSITIECDDLEECSQISKILEDFKKKPKRESLSDSSMHGIEQLKAVEQPGNRFIPLTKWEDYHPWPTTAGLRHLVFFSDTNGFNSCIKRIGSRVIIDEKAFFAWVQKQ